MRSIVIVFSLFFSSSILGQSIQLLHENRNTSLRGLSLVNENVIWTSGSNGTVGRSIDGGNSFSWIEVEGYGKRDFRDVEAFDSSTAIIMAISEPAIILKTRDGGKTWKKVFEDSTKGMFWDAMDFDGPNGVVIGDPISNKIYLAETNDYGDSWSVNDRNTLNPVMLSGEAFFASSGSNIKIFHKKIKSTGLFYVSGGIQSRLFFENRSELIPLQSGRNSTGANSIDYLPTLKKGIIVGGDFANDKRNDSSCVLFSFDKKIIFSSPQTPLHGYRSSVVYLSENKIIACGTSGIDFSEDGGKNWRLISTVGFHVVKKSPKGNIVFFGGSNGILGKLIY